MTAGWYQVTLPHYCCGFELDAKGTIVRCAPIMGWARGKHIEVFSRWALTRGGSFRRVPSTCCPAG